MHWLYPVRAVQVVFGIIVLGLTATGIYIPRDIPPKIYTKEKKTN